MAHVEPRYHFTQTRLVEEKMFSFTMVIYGTLSVRSVYLSCLIITGRSASGAPNDGFLPNPFKTQKSKVANLACFPVSNRQRHIHRSQKFGHWVLTLLTYVLVTTKVQLADEKSGLAIRGAGGKEGEGGGGYCRLAPIITSNIIASLHVTSRWPCWWSRIKAVLSFGSSTLFSCKFFDKKFHCIDPEAYNSASGQYASDWPQHGHLVTWFQTKKFSSRFIQLSWVLQGKIAIATLAYTNSAIRKTRIIEQFTSQKCSHITLKAARCVLTRR